MNNTVKFLLLLAGFILFSLLTYAIVILKSENQQDSGNQLDRIKATFKIQVTEEHKIDNRDNPLRAFKIQFIIRNNSPSDYLLVVPAGMQFTFLETDFSLPLGKKSLQSANLLENRIIPPGATETFEFDYHGHSLPRNLRVLEGQAVIEWQSSDGKPILKFKYLP